MNQIYTDASTQKNQVLKMVKSTGAIDFETLFLNSAAVGSPVATIEMNSDSTKWVVGLQETGSNNFAFAIGQVSDNKLLSYYKSTTNLKSNKLRHIIIHL